MAGDILRDLFVRVGVQTDKAQWAQMQRSVDQAKSGLMDIAKGAAIVGAGLYAVRKFVGGMTAIGDQARKTAQAVGVSVAALQTFQHAGELGGMTAEEVGTGLRFLAKSSQEAAQGAKQYLDAYQRLGVNVRKSDGSLKNSEELMMEIADRFKAMPDGAQKTALSMQIFGRAGSRMIPMLNEGSGAIAAYRKELEELGLLLTDEEAKAMEEYNNDMLRLDKGFRGLRMTIVKAILPAVHEFVNALRERLKPILEWLKKNTGLVIAAFKVLGVVIAGIGIGFMIAGVVKLTMAVAGLAVGLHAMGLAGLWAFTKMTIGPLIIAAGIYALYLIVQDLWKALTDPTAITEFGAILSYWKTEFEDLLRTIKELLGISGKATTPEQRAQQNFNRANVSPGVYAPPQIPGSMIPSSVSVQIGQISIDAQGGDSVEISKNIVTEVTERLNGARRGLAGGY
jgi:TP901 family phage tail tape measure protein